MAVTGPATGPHIPTGVRRRSWIRTATAVAILVAWSAGLSLMLRRELFATDAQRLAEAALRISPGAVFYVVERDGRQVGFASTTIDTMPTGVDVVDYLIADEPVAGSSRRASARSVTQLSRGLSLRSFDVQTDLSNAPQRSGGRTDGDSMLVFAVSAAGVPRDSQRVPISGRILLPALVPLGVALGQVPKVGRRYAFPMFNPATSAYGILSFVIRAESLFTLVDSASLDPLRGEWVGARSDTVRAWRVESADSAGTGDFSGWVDGTGRVVERSLPGGLRLRRMAYEIAFENWRIARERSTSAASGADAYAVLERTAVSAGVLPGRSRLSRLAVVVHGVELRSYDVAGGRQSLAADTLRVREEGEADLVPSWSLLKDFRSISARFPAALREEPLLQVHDQRIMRLAVRIAGSERDPRAIAERVNRWVHDSLTKTATFGVPNALAVLRERRGDCNEHTQLAVALVRSLGIPARAATGLAYVGGKFYYHAWPEVFLKEWVAMDPTFGQFPADAAHLRFLVGGVPRQTELMRLISSVNLSVAEAR